MQYATITLTVADHIARITLNRPGADNAINQQMAQELADACLRVNRDDDVYVVVITGAGDQAFCTGSEPDAHTNGTASAIAAIERPVVVALNGDALGQGLELALAGDIRLAADKARFGLPAVSRGHIPTDGGTQRLPRIVGRTRALELILTAETIDAGKALEMGLISQVVTAEELSAATDAVATAIAGKAPAALRYAKEAVTKGLELTLEQGLRLEADLYLLLHTTADRKEGITAFLEKRTPQFKGL